MDQHPKRESSVPSLTPVPSRPMSPKEIADAVPVRGPMPGVLVVDDSDWSRELIMRFLAALKVPIEGAGSAREALEKARRNPPAVILSDWMMPEMDGLELCQAVRQDRQLSTTHFLILTAKGEQEDLVKAFTAGADDFLTKPVNDSELRARVRVGLRLHMLYRETEAHRQRAEANEASLREAEADLREANRRLDEQIHEIVDLQASFLPQRFTSAGGLTFAAFCRPCTEVGGDYYDVFKMPDGRVCITMADVTGHGARAAVCMAMTRSLTRAASTQMRPEDGPAWMLERINNWLCDQLSDAQFVTMWLGIWNPEEGRLRYCRAGHPTAVLWRAGQEPAMLPDEGTHPVGVFGFRESPEVATLDIAVGDRLFLYTDGWTETMDPTGKLFEEEGFLASVKAAQGVPLEGLPMRLYGDLEKFAEGEPLADDISLLILERRAP